MNINTAQLNNIPHAKNSNPVTSFIAAQEVMPHLTQRCQDVLKVLKTLGQATSKDIAPYTPFDSAEVGRRLSDLEKLNLAKPVLKDGELIVRKRCRVWEAI